VSGESRCQYCFHRGRWRGEEWRAPGQREGSNLTPSQVEERESFARRYWSPHDAGSVSEEILFAGDIEVIAERGRLEFGIV
jgi:hypothetical protein